MKEEHIHKESEVLNKDNKPNNTVEVVKMCSRCRNEEILGRYCHICGLEQELED